MNLFSYVVCNVHNVLELQTSSVHWNLSPIYS